jgi:CDP-glycerol glycerophosphotransferase (TagB/SpsB family)
MKYLFYVAKLYSIAIIRPLAELLDLEGRDWALFVSDSVDRRLPEDLKQKQVFTELKAAIAYRPSFVIVPGNFVDHRIPGVKVQIFHGLGVEKESHFKIRHFFDVYLTSGPYVTQRFMKTRAKNPYFEVIETGWLKIDSILKYPAEGIRERMAIPPGKKVILYAPTFSRTMESAAELASVIPAIIRDDEYWLMKFHQLMPKELIEPFSDLDSGKARLIKDDDITPCLHAANLLISDTSSVVYEFMALDKPVITYKTISRPDKAFDIRSKEALRDAIEKCITYPKELKVKRDRAMAEVNPYLDGSIAQKTLKALNCLDPDSFPRPGKPLNLFRKAQICWHATFRKGYLR